MRFKIIIRSNFFFQAKLERSGFKVFENYQNAISERRRSSDANAHSTSSGSSSAATSDDEQEQERTGRQFLEVPLVVEPANDEETRKRKQGTMVRRASANDMAKIGEEHRNENSKQLKKLAYDSSFFT